MGACSGTALGPCLAKPLSRCEQVEACSLCHGDAETYSPDKKDASPCRSPREVDAWTCSEVQAAAWAQRGANIFEAMRNAPEFHHDEAGFQPREGAKSEWAKRRLAPVLCKMADSKLVEAKRECPKTVPEPSLEETTLDDEAEATSTKSSEDVSDENKLTSQAAQQVGQPAFQTPTPSLKSTGETRLDVCAVDTPQPVSRPRRNVTGRLKDWNVSTTEDAGPMQPSGIKVLSMIAGGTVPAESHGKQTGLGEKQVSLITSDGLSARQPPNSGRRSESTPARASQPRRFARTGSSLSEASEQTSTDALPSAPSTFRESSVSTEICRSLGSVASESSTGEAWADFAARASLRLKAAGIGDGAQALFEAFRTAGDLELIYATFACMFHQAKNLKQAVDAPLCAPWSEPGDATRGQWKYPYELIRVLVGGNWKANSLWKLLDERCARPEYEDMPCSIGHLAGRKVVVVGAGPCGLRAAIELRLLGARVTVVDRRNQFSRINQLHLWTWCGDELKALGARVLEPPPSDFGSNPDLLHVGISDLQKLLVKVALLLGVEVLLGADYVSTEWSAQGCWSVRLGAPPSASLEGRAGDAAPVESAPATEMPPSPAAPAQIDGVAAVIAANGFASLIGPDSGLAVLETESLRRESAVGLICNFRRSNGNEERKLRSFSMAKQFYLALFQKVAETTGADLENIVYTKSHDSHYFVMTPTHKSLVEMGVIIDKAHKPLLARENVNQSKLDAFVRKVASFQFKATEPAVLSAALADLGGQSQVEHADSGPRLFDFSKMRRQVDGLTFLHPPTVSCSGEEEQSGDVSDSLLVAVVGDALIEPFWPEGLGIIRGFFSVMDACSAVAEWGKGADEAKVQLHFERAFQQLKTLGAATRTRVLRDDERQYRLAPASRYRQFTV